MTAFDLYQLDNESMTRNANQVLELLEQALYEDGIISEPNAISKRYVIQLVKPGLLTSFFDKTFMRDVKKDRAAYKVFRIEEIKS